MQKNLENQTPPKKKPQINNKGAADLTITGEETPPDLILSSEHLWFGKQKKAEKGCFSVF